MSEFPVPQPIPEPELPDIYEQCQAFNFLEMAREHGKKQILFICDRGLERSLTAKHVAETSKSIRQYGLEFYFLVGGATGLVERLETEGRKSLGAERGSSPELVSRNDPALYEWVKERVAATLQEKISEDAFLVVYKASTLNRLFEKTLEEVGAPTENYLFVDNAKVNQLFYAIDPETLGQLY